MVFGEPRRFDGFAGRGGGVCFDSDLGGTALPSSESRSMSWPIGTDSDGSGLVAVGVLRGGGGGRFSAESDPLVSAEAF